MAVNIEALVADESPEYLMVSEVAKKLRISKMAVYRLIHSGAMPAVQIGKSYRIVRVEFERKLAAGEIR